MDTNASSSKSQERVLKRLSLWAAIVATVLMIPLFTNAPWTVSDYIFAGIVLSICAVVYVFATRNMNNVASKIGVGAAVLFFIFLMMGWAASGP